MSGFGRGKKGAAHRSLNFLMYRVEDFDQSAEDPRGAPELGGNGLAQVLLLILQEPKNHRLEQHVFVLESPVYRPRGEAASQAPC
jgi:hypothetical protein